MKPKKAIYSGQKVVNKKPELSSVLTNVVSDNVNDENIAMVGGIPALEHYNYCYRSQSLKSKLN